ncbi:unnamed protein product [Clonostachys byssicola]|uniref:Uncharacterized protein n=1 Tax=Clonostachys byssicola TaxID=160290 RepID=A0A9N9UNZ2_9HYPO|nr:unnamed protein product [Clonostachys byssicola]
MYANLLTKTAAFALVAARVASAECFAWDQPALHCYNGPWDSPQDVSVEDVTYIGNYLRAHGLHDNKFWSMPAEDKVDCQEWEVYTYKTARLLAKHINPKANSSVLFEDIANTIDGGASRDEVGPAIIQCLADGGFAGVIFNPLNHLYNTDEYKKEYKTPEGILLKIVTTAPEEL